MSNDEPFSIEHLFAEDTEDDAFGSRPWSDVYQLWLRRAAVLAWFTPEMIGAPSDPEELQNSQAWFALLADCETVRTPDHGTQQRLKPGKRREILIRLAGDVKLWDVLAEVTVRPISDPIQWALERVISGSPIDIATLSQAELYSMQAVAEWFDGIVEHGPGRQAIAARLRREELLDPHRVLAEGFVGREEQLNILRGYIEEQPSTRFGSIRGEVVNLVRRVLDYWPLAIHGPAGVGKSSLVARLILEHAKNDGAVSIDLDFGRPYLNPSRPSILLAEAARQIAAQLPSVAEKGDRLAHDLEMFATLTSRGLESVALTGISDAVGVFVQFAAAALPPQRKVPFVLDNFEEVQQLGKPRVDAVWKLLQELQKGLPQLRPIICSRVQPSQSQSSLLNEILNLQLSELEPEAARAYLTQRLLVQHGKSVDNTIIAKVVKRIVRTPLGLNLAADAIFQAIEADKNPVDTVAWMVGRADEAFLYRRILQQIRDTELRLLATHGLAVRRLDADVVLKVLAGPAGLTLNARVDAEKLLADMQKQVALIERGADGSLRYRSDMRTLMLPVIQRTEGIKKIHQIDRNAVEYYASVPGLDAKVEHTYHLLRLGELDKAEEILRDPKIAPLLSGALDELESDARLVLGGRLGVTAGPAELREADDVRWERGIIAAADDLLSRGAYQQVLEQLDERPGRRHGTQVDRIEAEAALGVGNLRRALDVATRGLKACERAGDRETGIGIALSLVRTSLIVEDTALATDAAARAAAMITPADAPELQIRVLTARMAVARAAGNDEAFKRAAGEARTMLDRTTLNRIQPAVLRTLAGQIGGPRAAASIVDDRVRLLLQMALRRIGIEQKTDEVLEGLAEVISTWTKDAETETADIRRVLGNIGNAAPPRSTDDAVAWRDWLSNVSGSQLGQGLADMMKLFDSKKNQPHAERLQGVLARYMSRAAQDAVESGSRRAPDTITIPEIDLGGILTRMDYIHKGLSEGLLGDLLPALRTNANFSGDELSSEGGVSW